MSDAYVPDYTPKDAGDLTPDIMRILDALIPELHSKIETELTHEEWLAIGQAIAHGMMRIVDIMGAMLEIPVIKDSFE